ncbi:hypothetical protein QR680_016204 [Steinernema hermaphroditum]|uniref:Secreted protein n=1 Tax=Steinernema hermaphroditum TaxID=289476 RepID=A0AA39HCD2_9BILA|nr:hypothetical protein QR680_016204 [Steinernema hermaphroditum]
MTPRVVCLLFLLLFADCLVSGYFPIYRAISSEQPYQRAAEHGTQSARKCLMWTGTPYFLFLRQDSVQNMKWQKHMIQLC